MEAWGRESPVCPLARPWSWGRSTLALQQCPGEGQGFRLLSQPNPASTEPWFLHIPPHQGVHILFAMCSAAAAPVLQLLERARAQNWLSRQ